MENNKVLLIEDSTALWGRNLKEYKKVLIFTGKFRGAETLPHDFLTLVEYYLSHYKAGALIDWVYERYIKKTEAEIFNRVMKDERTELIIKKEVLRSIGEIFLSFILADKFIKEYAIEEEIDFIPKAFPLSLYKILSERHDLFSRKIRIPDWYLKELKRKERIKNTFYRFALFCYPFAISLLMSLKNNIAKHKKEFKYGMFLWSSALQLPVPPCIELLVDNDNLKHAEILYVIDNRINENDLEDKIRSKKYNYWYFKEAISHFSIFQYIGNILPQVLRMALSFFCVSSDKMIVNEAYLRSLSYFIKWQIFYEQYYVDTFIYAQDPGNILRVICQKNHGSRNIFVFLSTSFDPALRENMKSHGDSYYSFMIYDRAASSRMSNEYLKLNNNSISSYSDCGILYSDLVYRIKHDTCLKNELKGKFGIPLDKTAIGFFDTAIGRMAMFTEDEGFLMFSDILRLLESNDNYYLLYKSRGDSNLSKNSKVKSISDKLINCKRVFYVNEFIANNYYQPQYFMGVSDLVISAFSSSVSMEAVAGGVRTICYVPSARFDSSKLILNEFPRFCVRNYEELEKFSDYWINCCSEEDFREFQNNYVKKYIDSYCDGKALNRLYALLRR